MSMKNNRITPAVFKLFRQMLNYSVFSVFESGSSEYHPVMHRIRLNRIQPLLLFFIDSRCLTESQVMFSFVYSGNFSIDFFRQHKTIRDVVLIFSRERSTRLIEPLTVSVDRYFNSLSLTSRTVKSRSGLCKSRHGSAIGSFTICLMPKANVPCRSQCPEYGL